MENEIEILKKQIEALKELVAIKDQIIAAEKARATQYIYVQGPTQYIPQPQYPYYPYTTWITTAGSGVVGQTGCNNGMSGVALTSGLCIAK